MPAILTVQLAPVGELQQSFLTLLPTIEAKARSAFRSVHHYHDREDAVAEVVALAWERYLATNSTGAAELATGVLADVQGSMSLNDN